jgi:hypothetical protein
MTILNLSMKWDLGPRQKRGRVVVRIVMYVVAASFASQEAALSRVKGAT